MADSAPLVPTKGNQPGDQPRSVDGKYVVLWKFPGSHRPRPGPGGADMGADNISALVALVCAGPFGPSRSGMGLCPLTPPALKVYLGAARRAWKCRKLTKLSVADI